MIRDPLDFTDLEESTKNVKTKINNIQFNEEELFDKIECNKHIISVKTPTRYKEHERYGNLNFKKKTNRGRKKKIVEEKKDKRGFGTCIQFEILMFCICDIDKNARYFKNAIIRNNKMYYPEEWKIKLFRNGTITVAGVKKEKQDNYDKTMKYFLNVLKQYLNFSDNDVEYQDAKLNNFKTELVNYHIDINRLEKFFIGYFKNICYISIKNVIKIIKTPSIVGINEFKWNYLNKLPKDFKIDTNVMLMRALNSEDKNVAKIPEEDFKLKLKLLKIEKIYSTISTYIDLLKEYKVINEKTEFISECIENIIYYMTKKEIDILMEALLVEKDISISRYLYSSNKFSALSIYFNVYDDGIRNEPVVKLFPSGKINIDGCSNIKNVPRIFKWIETLLEENPEFTYNEKTWGRDCHLDTEFSMTESE